MLLFKVTFTNNVAASASPTLHQKQVEWKENPYSILSVEVYANNNIHALKIAQAKADALLKENK